MSSGGGGNAGAREGPAAARSCPHSRGAGRDARPPHPPARGDSRAREPARGLQAPACAPPHPQPGSGRTSKALALAATGPSEAGSPPACLGCPRPGSGARAHVCCRKDGFALTLCKILLNMVRPTPPPLPPRGLSAPDAGNSRLEGAKAGSRAGRRAGATRWWTLLGRPRLAHGRREAASTSPARW